MRVIEPCLALLHAVGVASAFRSSGSSSPARRHSSIDAAFLGSPRSSCQLSHQNVWPTTTSRTALRMSPVTESSVGDDRPQAFATGYSTNPSLAAAIEEATNAALSSLPPATDLQFNIDLAVVVASSLYEEPSTIVPSVIKVVESSSGLYGYGGVRHLVGNTAGGVIGSRSTASTSKDAEGNEARECRPVEAEAAPAISVTLALLPDVELQTFHLSKEDVPEFDGQFTRGPNAAKEWKRSVGLGGFGASVQDLLAGAEGTQFPEEVEVEEEDEPIFLVIPSPAFQNNLDDFLRGLQFAFPKGQTFGGVASTVSSLSRARIFAYSADGASVPQNSVYGDGCVGVALKGDVRVDTMIAQGAKPVGGVYRVVAAGSALGSKNAREDEGSRSTIGAIVLDEAATVEEFEGEDEEEEEVEGDVPAADDKEAKRAKLMDEYAKARIPKPPLAEANFVMKKLSDDDQAFMRRALLIGLERGGGSMVGRTPNELARLAKGEGHRFTVRQIASAGMKDGSVTFPLGSVDVSIGARCRFFVRDGDFAKKEVEALWTGYKKKELEGTLMGGDAMSPPTACFVLPTLDRGAKLFGGKEGYESGTVSDFLPGVPSISGFFANGVLGRLDGTMTSGGSNNDNMLHGSSSQYVVFRSKTKRPFYSPQKAREAAAVAAALKAEEASAEQQLAAEDEKRAAATKPSDETETTTAAPRSDDGELVVRRREIHSGRALSVSTVEWSVAEKTAKPTSALEGYMWEKETQVDRLRERVPLAQLMSNTKVAMMDPSKPKPRDWIGPVRRAAGEGSFVIIPECKRMEPVSGSLRKRYDLPKLVKQLTAAGAPAISVNSDGVLFGGTMEDITEAREASDAAAVSASLESSDGDGAVAPPVLASDLLLYPYQLYKLRLAGADAVTLVVGALESKDLLYLTKIASTIQMQVVASVTSVVQIEMLSKLGAGSVVALVVSNRDLETFDFDDRGEQALSLLKSEALASFREKHGEDVPVLVEGRVGIVEAEGGDSVAYIQALKDAGAFGAIVGGGMATVAEEDAAEAIGSWSL